MKRQCPEEKELFTLVALHFRLYYEIALMWENEAKEIVTKLMSDAMKDCGKSTTDIHTELKLTRNDNVQSQLQLVMINFTHATQYYLQVGYWNHYYIFISKKILTENNILCF